MNDEEIVLVFSEHIAFGWKFSAFCASGLNGDRRQIYGATSVQSFVGVSADIKQALQWADDMSDAALLRDYSRGSSVLEFQRDVSKDILERFIRPRIEMLNRKIAETALRADIPVYLRLDRGGKTLYEHDRIKFCPHPARCIFHFIKDAQGFRYSISLTAGGRKLALQSRTGLTASNKPCWITIGKTMYHVEEIEARKLSPFFAKESIPVPPQVESTYLKSFVCKTMQDYEVELRGIPFREIDPSVQACLSLERDLDLFDVLTLSFLYGDNRRIFPDDPVHKHVTTEEIDGQTGLCLFHRKLEWEQQMMDQLVEAGLQLVGGRRLYAPSRKAYALIEWLNRNHKLLDGFHLQSNNGKAYHLGGSSLQSEVEQHIDWFEINIIVQAGQFSLPLSSFRHHILNNMKEYELPDGTIFILPDEWFDTYKDMMLFASTDKKNKNRLRLQTIHASLLDGALGASMDEASKRIVDSILRIPVQRPELPKHAAQQLRPYQKEGFYWMCHLYTHRFGGCLADDMGLGKTIQTIALLEYIYSQPKAEQKLPPSLLVVPTSLLHNWKNELARFAPELRCLMHIGSDRCAYFTQAMMDNNQVIITSYGTLRNDIRFMSAQSYQLVVLDESQYVKNPESQTYQAVARLVSHHRLALTGTPLENSLEDLWAQFNFLNKGLLGTRTAFRNIFVRPTSKEQAHERDQLLKRTISPFILRRTKEEVTPELPPLIEEVVYCDMSEAQSEAYNAEKNRIRNLIFDAMAQPEQPLNKILALEAMHRLRQLANHPALILPDYTEDSGKVEQILLSFESLKNSGHKALIFSSYVKYLDLLARHFDQERWPYLMLTGKTRNREEVINQFTHSNINCFFISLKAGSTGLNLTAADYVFILDPWWNPAAEMQALSRAHRIGQDKTVMSFRFISTDTIEEKILQLQQHKTDLYDAFISANNPLDQFTWEDFEQLIK
ncbi:MAG: DEAD/DEAH box helicase [Tannerellaceae bacterium]|jgi:superfamily II DNA or RNA helicase|nr:DEAD/DEAH box helicase [Tannerellaceae bacterium]